MTEATHATSIFIMGLSHIMGLVMGGKEEMLVSTLDILTTLNIYLST
jgi:glycine/serine hydroxymethyltransferase